MVEIAAGLLMVVEKKKSSSFSSSGSEKYVNTVQCEVNYMAPGCMRRAFRPHVKLGKRYKYNEPRNTNG